MLRHLQPVLRQCGRRYISALYITGDKANQNYAILTPYFDFNSRLAESAEQALHANIRQRRSAVDVTQLLQMWQVYRDVQQKKANLEKRRVEIADTLKEMTRKGEPPADEDLQRKYKAEGTFVREDLKRLKEHSYHMEDLFVHQFLALPNELHPRTPIDQEDVVHQHLSPPTDKLESCRDHLSRTDLIEYHDPYCYFLRGEAAEFDLAVSFGFVDAFRQTGFVHFSNPDFCKSILAEAAGLDPAKLLTVTDDAEQTASVNLTHLCGAGSLIGYLGYISKLSIFKSALPLRLVSSGRSYIRTQSDQPDLTQGLFAVSQSNRVQMFQALADARHAELAFDETISQLAELYQQFDQHFRLVQVPAHRLAPAESLRVNVEMHNRLRGSYVEVGHVAYYGDYISKRLLFGYKDPGAKSDEPHFAHLIGGSLVDATRLLAVLLENGDAFRVPERMRLD